MRNTNFWITFSFIALNFAVAEPSQLSKNYYLDCDSDFNKNSSADSSYGNFLDVLSSINTELQRTLNGEQFSAFIILKRGTLCTMEIPNFQFINQSHILSIHIGTSSAAESSKSNKKGEIIFSNEFSMTLINSYIELVDIILRFETRESKLHISSKKTVLQNVMLTSNIKINNFEKILYFTNTNSLVLDSIYLMDTLKDSTILQIRNTNQVVIKNIDLSSIRVENASLLSSENVLMFNITNITIANSVFLSTSSVFQICGGNSNTAVHISAIKVANSSFNNSTLFDFNSTFDWKNQLNLLKVEMQKSTFSDSSFLSINGSLATLVLDRVAAFHLNFTNGSLLSFRQGTQIQKQSLYEHSYTNITIFRSTPTIHLIGDTVQMTNINFTRSVFMESIVFQNNAQKTQEITIRRLSFSASLLEGELPFWSSKGPVHFRLLNCQLTNITTQGDFLNFSSEGADIIIRELSVQTSNFKAALLVTTNPIAVELANITINAISADAIFFLIKAGSLTKILTNRVTLENIRTLNTVSFSGIFLEISACPKIMKWSNISNDYNRFGEYYISCPNTKFILENQLYLEEHLLLQKVIWNIWALDFIMQEVIMKNLIFEQESKSMFKIDVMREVRFNNISVNGCKFKNDNGFIQSVLYFPRLYINGITLEAEEPAHTSPFKGMKSSDVYISKLTYRQKDPSKSVSNFIISDVNSPLGLHIKDSYLEVYSSSDGVISLRKSGARFSLENTQIVFPKNKFEGAFIYIDADEYCSFSKLIGIVLRDFTVAKVTNKSFITVRGGSLLVSNSILMNITYNKNEVSLFDFDNITNVEILNSTISNLFIQSSLFVVTGGIFTMTNSTISNLTQNNSNGTFLNCKDAGEFLILRSIFTSLRAGQSGGAIYSNDCSGVISHSIFEGVEAEIEGGTIAAYLKNRKMLISSCTFRANKPDRPAAVSIVSDNNSQAISCYFMDTIFDNNENFGGRSELEDLVSSNINFENNYQEYPDLKITIDGEYTNKYYMNFSNNSVSSKIIVLERLDVETGKELPNSQYKVLIQAEYETSSYYPEPKINLIAKTSNGEYLTGSQLKIEILDRLELQLGVQVNAEWLLSLNISIKPFNSLSDKNTVTIIPLINGCLIDDITKNKNSCGCEPGQFMSNLFDADCKTCKQGLICLEEHQFMQREGFYADFSHFDSSRCPITWNCLEAMRNESFEHNRCKTGTNGNLCVVCEEHWIQLSVFSCLSCEEISKLTIAITLLIPIILWIALLATVAVKSYDSSSQKANSTGNCLLLIVSASQYLTLMIPLRLSSGFWIDTLLGFFRSISQTNLDIAQIYSCHFQARENHVLVAILVLPFLRTTLVFVVAFLLKNLSLIKSFWYFILEYFWMALAMDIFGLFAIILALITAVQGNPQLFEVQYGHQLNDPGIYSEYLILFLLSLGLFILLAIILRFICRSFNNELLLFSTGISGQKLILNPNIARLGLNLSALIFISLTSNEKLALILNVIMLLIHLYCILCLWKSPQYSGTKPTEIILFIEVLIVFLISVGDGVTQSFEEVKQGTTAFLLILIILTALSKLILNLSKGEKDSSNIRARDSKIELNPNERNTPSQRSSGEMEQDDKKIEKLRLFDKQESSSSNYSAE